MQPLVAYHGAHRWQGPPQLLPAKNMKAIEHGPGFYLTMGVDTAIAYAKGGGSVLRFELEPHISWLEDHKISYKEQADFVRSLPRLRHKQKILDDLQISRARSGDNLSAAIVGNLMHYHGVAHGEAGLALVRFYLDHNIDADIVRNRGYQGNETWIVLYNLDKILKYEKVRA